MSKPIKLNKGIIRPEQEYYNNQDLYVPRNGYIGIATVNSYDGTTRSGYCLYNNTSFQFKNASTQTFSSNDTIAVALLLNENFIVAFGKLA